MENSNTEEGKIIKIIYLQEQNCYLVIRDIDFEKNEITYYFTSDLKTVFERSFTLEKDIITIKDENDKSVGSFSKTIFDQKEEINNQDLIMIISNIFNVTLKQIQQTKTQEPFMPILDVLYTINDKYKLNLF